MIIIVPNKLFYRLLFSLMLLMLVFFCTACGVRGENADSYFNNGCDNASKGQYNIAIENYNKVIELDPKYVDAYYRRGNVYFSKGQYDLAIRDYNKAIEIDPQDACAYYDRGKVHVMKCQSEAAIADYSKAIEIDPKQSKLYLNKAIICEMTGYKSEAIKAYTLFLRYASNTDPDIKRAQYRIKTLGGTI